MSTQKDREDHFYHPASEAELVTLVKRAYVGRVKLRVRGSAHSVSHAIYTDPPDLFPYGVNQQSPPDDENINVMLDKYAGWTVRSEAHKLVEVKSGTHLGGDPNNPRGRVLDKDGLLGQLWRRKKWTLSDLGGITHQTVSGFTATGSAGGSLRYSANKNVQALRVIDGTGEIYVLSADDDSDAFYSMVPNLGLLGVISTITLMCVDTFDIKGSEAITGVTADDGCKLDLFGPGNSERPSLARFLRDTDFARIEWWPQEGAARVVVWQAQKIASSGSKFRPRRYQEFPKHPLLSQFEASIIFTILGNLDNLSAAAPQLEEAFKQHQPNVDQSSAAVASLLGGDAGTVVAAFLDDVLARPSGTDIRQAIVTAIAREWGEIENRWAEKGWEWKGIGGVIRDELPIFFPKLLDKFVELDKTSHRGAPKEFADHSWRGLPMDSAVFDQLLPTEFTEMWVPLGRTQKVMETLDCYFKPKSDPAEAYRRTGTYAFELYGEVPSRFWLNPAYTDGTDEWRDGAFRVDVYWFALNAEDPVERFFPQFWNLLRDEGIPIRFHWGKFLPRGSSWVSSLRGEYPQWAAFMRERARRDPEIFLTKYWRDHLGLPD